MFHKMAKLHFLSTPEIVARNKAAVEFCPTSATWHAKNSFPYPPSETVCVIV